MPERKLTTKDLERVLPVLEKAFDVITEANLASMTPELPFFTLTQLGEKFGMGFGEFPTVKQMAGLARKIQEAGLPIESIEYQGIASSFIQHTDRLFPWASRKETKD